MDCQTLALLIEDYLTNQLTPTIRSEVKAHLLTCNACRARVNDFARLDDFLREMPRAVVPAQLAMRIQQQVHAHELHRRVGHTLPIALATFCSAVVFIWLASETWLALQDRALWEFINWFVNVPDILWEHPSDVLAAFTDFAPISGLIFTLGFAFSSWWLGMRLIAELRNPSRLVR